MSLQWCSLLLVAALGAPLSVIGDLFASVVKRRFGVKDYGKLMPGHGGVMDRFDSVLPVAVLLLLWISVCPIL
ncbi:MAG: phosphatidate cytidylyltransferase [Clostridia bacterium]|nr:phosphatidate cytidylyltransferase [Clostridia bacterium]